MIQIMAGPRRRCDGSRMTKWTISQTGPGQPGAQFTAAPRPACGTYQPLMAGPKGFLSWNAACPLMRSISSDPAGDVVKPPRSPFA